MNCNLPTTLFSTLAVIFFLTGKAGTGKTTFLHNLQKNTAKRMIITAPTGVAALNAGGVPLHSFFQLPFGPFVPGSETYESNKQRQFRFSKEKKRIIQIVTGKIVLWNTTWLKNCTS